MYELNNPLISLGIPTHFLFPRIIKEALIHMLLPCVPNDCTLIRSPNIVAFSHI